MRKYSEAYRINSLLAKVAWYGLSKLPATTGIEAVLPTRFNGYSSAIKHPSFARYQRDSRTWSFLFASILAVFSLIGFPIYGNLSGEISWPFSILYGLLIGAMFVGIAALQSLKRKLDKTWDGKVFDKQIIRVRERRKNGKLTEREVFSIQIEKDNGKIKTEKWRDPALFNYYDVGDMVRHHKGFAYYEKYDKSGDEEILCIACNSFNDINGDFCFRCKRPLLK